MKRTELLSRLWEFQNNYGYISDKAITEIAQKLNVSKIEIEGVISFYHFFHLQPTGKHIIYLNNSIVSEFKGFSKVKAAFEKETGCTFGAYCKDPLFSLFETSCIGLSDQEPAALIDFYPFTDLTPDKVKLIIRQLKSGTHPEEISNNPKSKIQYTPKEEKSIFFRDYKLGTSLKKLKTKDVNSILKIISDSQLDGQGGAFFPTAIKWKSCKENSNKTKYIICNADEGEPGTFKDKSLLNNLPGLVIEGMIIAAYVTGAKKGFIYLRAEYKYLLKKIENTLEEFKQKGFLGKQILGIENFNFKIKIILGAGAYVCGAETALIESMEGKRGEPRIRKYFPTDIGYLGKSTIVNNVETFAKAARIIELDTKFISSIGTEKSKGTKLLSISGDVAKPGIYEIEWGMTVNKLLELCQATSPHYVQISGPSGVCINNSEFNRKICKEDLICGGSVMVFNNFRSITRIIENFVKFFKEESCGSCTPCRAGNQILYEKIKKIKRGICTTKDLEDIKEWGKIMQLTSRCGLGQFSANTFIMAIDKFDDYFNLKVTTCDNNCKIEFDMQNAVYEYDNLIKNTQLEEVD
ncbi:NAD(P)H-dependent oxidoreductase subunit E [Lutibacter flavus]|uniref:[NiFe] hydrogenase diaphorase moiety large subunit n=1 Tax=Lutibacter flavus TaxID=691689 RepID=A0A238W047_9FLAO|nr:NAD(P)H-dependent oxidoreductase subunit E [Lutibacter flavus]SNR39797.1 [NiFe] hydrogenase diaphorase moiety large subunit [Lutibacter flavus]